MEQPGPVKDREVMSDPDEERLPGRDVIIILAVIFEGSLAPLSLFLGWWIGHNPLSRFSWVGVDALWGAAAMLPLAAIFLSIIRWPLGPLRQIKQFCEEEFVPLLAGSSWSDIALIALSAGVGEEMLFRGVVQSALGSWLGVYWGLVLASVLFGLLHPISLPYVVVTTCVGFYIGLTYLLSGNLLTAIVAHGLYDFVLMAYLLKRHPGEPSDDAIPPVDPHEDIDD